LETYIPEFGELGKIYFVGLVSFVLIDIKKMASANPIIAQNKMQNNIAKYSFTTKANAVLFFMRLPFYQVVHHRSKVFFRGTYLTRKEDS